MISYDNPKNLIKDYMSDIETSSQDGAYLAGVLAAKVTKSDKLGVVISAADTNWYKQAGGFTAGARSVNPDVKVSLAQVGQVSYDDAAGGKRVMQAMIATGADVVFGMGDGATQGYIQAVETSSKKVWFIDVIGNPTPIDKKGAVLSSVLWDFSKVFKQAIADINAGRYGTKYYTLGLNNGVSLLQTKYISGRQLEAHPADPQGDHQRLDQGAADARQEVGHRADQQVASDVLASEQQSAGSTAGADAPAVELIGITKAFPGVVANDDIDLDNPLRRGALPARRERSGQVDADERPLRDDAARCRPHPRRRQGRPHRLAAQRARASASAWSTSTRRSCPRSACSRTCCSARAAACGWTWPPARRGWPRSPARSGSRSTRPRAPATSRSASSSRSRSSRRSGAARTC